MDVSKIEKYHNQIREVTQGDGFVAEMILFEAGRGNGLSILGRYPFIFHGLLSVISNLLYPLMGLKRKVKLNNDDDFAFISCPDPIFRTKTINLIAGDLKYGIIYLPTFHISAALKYHKFFERNHIRAYFPTIKIRYVLEAKRRLSFFKKRCAGLDNNIECQRLLSTLSMFLIYDGVVKEYLKEASSFNGKWILEHDKYYFMPAVSNIRQAGDESIMLQHGVFFRKSHNYFPLFCDKVLCCSEREKRIYAKNGVAKERVIVFGAPLQTLQFSDAGKDVTRHYEMLVLLTEIKESNKEIISSVLSFIKQNYDSVLIRLRPRSRKTDEALLGDVLHGFALSRSEKTIIEDINSCNKVVSFSEDANVEVAKLHKPFIFVWNEGEQDLKSMGNCATIGNYKEEINKLMNMTFYSTFSPEQYEEVIGVSDVAKLREKFLRFIKNKCPSTLS